MSADLIVIIALAAFVVYKYRQVLGHKTGHDVETPRSQANKAERVVQLRQYQQVGDEEELLAIPAPELKDEAFDALTDAPVKTALNDIKQADSSFNLDAFLSGAKGAFDMVMQAFEEEDRQTLKMLLSDDLYREFDGELKQYAKTGQRPHTTLVAVLSAKVTAASLEKNVTKLTIEFLSEQIRVVKDAKGNVIEGDVSQIEQVEDEWVFERSLRSRNPNWTIIDM